MKRNYKIFFAALTTLVVLMGCSSEKKQHKLFYFNDFESMEGWSKFSTLVKGEGYSGNCCVRVDSLFEFSDGFNLKLREVSDKPIRKIKFSAYCLTKNANSKATLVIAVDSLNKPNISWTGIALNTVIKEHGKWEKISGEVDITGQGINNRQNSVILYLWNNSKGVSLIDDIEIEFVE
jgi:hypothetical protein